MRPVFASRLTVLPNPSDDPSAHHDRLTRMAHQWIANVAARHEVGVIHAPGDSGRFANSSNRCHGETIHGSGDSECVWRGTIVHAYVGAHGPDPHVNVRSEIQIRTDEADSVVTFRLLVGSAIDLVVPLWVDIKTPRMVHELLETFPVMIGNIEVRPGPWRVDAVRIPVLVEMITRHDRGVPVVVVSKTPEQNALVNPQILAKELAGLAQVAELADFETAYALTSRLGNEIRCFNGAVRIYWPRFAITDSKFHHVLYPPERIKDQDLGHRLPRMLFRKIAGVAALAIGPDPRAFTIEREAEQAYNRALLQRLDALQEARKTGRDAEALLEDAFQEIDRVGARNRELDGLLTEADRIIKDLEDQNNRLSARIMAAPGAFPDEDETEDRSDQIAGLRTLQETLRFAEELHGGSHIVFLNSAYETAEESPFRASMSDAYAAIREVCGVAREWNQGTLGVPFTEAFTTRGLSYGQRVNVARAGEHKQAYYRSWGEGRRKTQRLMNHHLRVGKGNPEDSLRIYWFLDEEAGRKRFVIGHVGKHLPDSTT